MLLSQQLLGFSMLAAVTASTQVEEGGDGGGGGGDGWVAGRVRWVGRV